MSLPEAAANLVLQELRVRCVEDLHAIDDLAWECGCLVADGPLEGAEARISAVRNRGIITVSDAVESRQRRRFCIAHELGHFRLHRKDSAILFCEGRDIDARGQMAKDRTRAREQEASAFASALLMPKFLFQPRCAQRSPSFDLVEELARVFDTSLTATALRYLRFCDESCVVIFSRDGHTRWSQGSKDFDELGVEVPKDSPLDSLSYAASFFAGREIPRSADRVDAAAWFEPGGYKDDAAIREFSWAMPRHNAVLTLLWVDMDIGADDAIDED